MAVYICAVCDTLEDAGEEGGKWEDLPDGGVCRLVIHLNLLRRWIL